MEKDQIKEIIEKLLRSVEEEDVGISLLTTLYQNESELRFFGGDDREHVLKVLRRLSADSRRHKMILERLIFILGEKCHAD